MNNIIIIVIPILIIGTILLATKFIVQNKSEGNQFKAKPIMTANELEFFERLKNALQECQIFPQVALNAIMDVDCDDKKERLRLRNKYAQKHADFIITDKSCNIICIMELDDRTHQTSRDRKRDKMLESAGYKTIRFQSGNKPNEKTLRESIKSILVKTE
jgi:hypothetical protein